MIFIVFDKITGRVMRKGRVSEKNQVDPKYRSSAVFDRDIDPATQYIHPLTRMTTPRPAAGTTIDKRQVIANGNDKARIDSIPPGATITVIDKNGKHIIVTINDGLLDLTFNVPGRHHVFIDAFPVQDVETVIDAD